MDAQSKKETTEETVAKDAENIQLFKLEAGHKCSIDCVTHGATIQGPAIITVKKTYDAN